MLDLEIGFVRQQQDVIIGGLALCTATACRGRGGAFATACSTDTGLSDDARGLGVGGCSGTKSAMVARISAVFCGPGLANKSKAKLFTSCIVMADDFRCLLLDGSARLWGLALADRA